MWREMDGDGVRFKVWGRSRQARASIDRGIMGEGEYEIMFGNRVVARCTMLA